MQPRTVLFLSLWSTQSALAASPTPAQLQRQIDQLRTEVLRLRTLLEDVSTGPNGELVVARSVVVEGGNLHVQDGTGAGTIEPAPNGLGNLIIGYDLSDGSDQKSGSHSLVMGDYHTWTSEGALVHGFDHVVTGDYAAAVGGKINEVTGESAVAVGGTVNVLEGYHGATIGGAYNEVTGANSVAIAGAFHDISGGNSGTLGGWSTTISGDRSAAVGGHGNVASGETSLVLGGETNQVSGAYATSVGGAYTLNGAGLATLVDNVNVSLLAALVGGVPDVSSLEARITAAEGAIGDLGTELDGVYNTLVAAISGVVEGYNGLFDGVYASLAALQAQDVALAAAADDLEARATSTEAAIAWIDPEVDYDAISDLLAYLSVSADGDVVISGANLRLLNGTGHTDLRNGKGNLVIGYNSFEDCWPDDYVPEAGGSHYLVVGDCNQYDSYAGILGGYANWSRAPYGSVVGGTHNVAAGDLAVVVGGGYNNAAGQEAVVVAGELNRASALRAVVLAGNDNIALGRDTAIGGGTQVTLATPAAFGYGP